MAIQNDSKNDVSSIPPGLSSYNNLKKMDFYELFVKNSKFDKASKG